MAGAASPSTSSHISSAIGAAMRTTLDLFRRRLPHSTTTTPTSFSVAGNSTATTSSLNRQDYHRLLSAFARDADADSALRVLRRMRHSPSCPPDATSYTIVMKALASASRPDAAAYLFDDMLASGVAPDRPAFTFLLKMYSNQLLLPNAAIAVFRWMTNSGFPPDCVAYSTLVAGLCRSGRLADAWNLLDEMLEKNCPPNAHTYAPILQSYCNKGLVHEAASLLESMRRSGLQPDTVIYNIQIQGLCKVAAFDEIERLIAESSGNGWEPDATTYSTYIAGLCRFGRLEEAFRQLDVMVGKGMQPTTIGLNILLCCVGQEMDVWMSKEVLEQCEELGFEVDVVTYNTLMSQFCKKRKWLSVVKLFTDMLKKAIPPDTQTFNILISSLCAGGKFMLAKFMFSSGGFVADTITCNILIREFYEAGRADELEFLFSDICAEKIAPDMITYNTLVDCFCRSGQLTEATHLVRHIQDGYPPEPVAHLTYWLVRIGNTGEAMRLIEELLVKGLVLDGRIFDYLIRAFCRKGPHECTEISKVCFVLDKMLGIQ